MRKRKITPLHILAGWIIIMLVLTPILMYTSDIGKSGGEQAPFNTLATMIFTLSSGVIVISILIPVFFWKWFKRNWWFTIFTILSLIAFSNFIWEYFFVNHYSIEETTQEINGNSFRTKTEFYNLETNQIRSIAYYKNEKKDSTWITYSKQGKIIKKELYKNDILITK